MESVLPTTTQPHGDRRLPGPGRRGTGTSTTRHGDRSPFLPSRCSSPCTTKSPAGGGLPAWRHTVEQMADVAPTVQILDALVPKSGDQLVDAFKHFDISVPEQVIEVHSWRKCSRLSVSWWCPRVSGRSYIVRTHDTQWGGTASPGRYLKTGQG